MSVIWGRRSGKALIKAIEIPYPSYNGILAYTGSEMHPAWVNYDENTVDMGGTIKATNDGTYTTTFTPKEGYCWIDNTTTPYSVEWTIYKEKLTVPSQSGTLTYNNKYQTPTWKNYSSTKLTIGGTTSGKNAGTFEAIFIPKSGYIWSDGTTAAKTVSWTINPAVRGYTLSQTSVTLSLANNKNGVEVFVYWTYEDESLNGLYPTGSAGSGTAYANYDVDNGDPTVITIIPKAVGSGSKISITFKGGSAFNEVKIQIPVTVTA